jgi:hypothetical protein
MGDEEDDDALGTFCDDLAFDHPVASGLADWFPEDYETIIGWFCDGWGFGQIMLALQTAEMTEDEGDSAQDYLDFRAEDQGWGEIWKELGLIGKPEDDGDPPMAPPDDGGPPDGVEPPDDVEPPMEPPDDAGPPMEPPDDAGPPDDGGPPDDVEPPMEPPDDGGPPDDEEPPDDGGPPDDDDPPMEPPDDGGPPDDAGPPDGAGRP